MFWKFKTVWVCSRKLRRSECSLSLTSQRVNEICRLTCTRKHCECELWIVRWFRLFKMYTLSLIFWEVMMFVAFLEQQLRFKMSSWRLGPVLESGFDFNAFTLLHSYWSCKARTDVLFHVSAALFTRDYDKVYVQYDKRNLRIDSQIWPEAESALVEWELGPFVYCESLRFACVGRGREDWSGCAGESIRRMLSLVHLLWFNQTKERKRKCWFAADLGCEKQ
jgi:hypothetical protein